MELVEISRVVFALIAVLAMIGLLAILARKSGLSAGGFSSLTQKRLSIGDSISLDSKRRIVLVKCDDTEHLLLLGATNETIIANNLVRSSSVENSISDAGALFRQHSSNISNLSQNPLAAQYAEDRNFSTEIPDKATAAS